MCHFYCTEGHETWVFRTWIGGLSHCARIFRLRWTVCSEIERKRLKRPGCRQPALAWDGDKVDFPCANWGERPVLQLLSALGLNASSSTNRAMYDFVTKLASLSRMLGSVWCAICPYSFRIITGSASKAEKGPNLIKQTFPKKGVGKFSKKNYISGISMASAFEWYASFVLSPPTPSNEPWSGGHFMLKRNNKCHSIADDTPIPPNNIFCYENRSMTFFKNHFCDRLYICFVTVPAEPFLNRTQAFSSSTE